MTHFCDLIVRPFDLGMGAKRDDLWDNTAKLVPNLEAIGLKRILLGFLRLLHI